MYDRVSTLVATRIDHIRKVIKVKTREHYWLIAEGPRLLSQLVETAVDYKNFKNLPKGSARPTIVIPGFATSNSSTYFLRRVLKENGHNPIKWCENRNFGFSEDILDNTCKQLRETALKYGQPVNLIGQSLGGCFARAAANRYPEYTNVVLTLGTPINSVTNVNKYAIEKYNATVGLADAAILQHTEYFNTFYPNPPVPCSSLYSHTDGVVHWSQSIINVTDLSENILIDPGHFGMGFDLDTIIIIADRLSRDKDSWEKWPDSRFT